MVGGVTSGEGLAGGKSTCQGLVGLFPVSGSGVRSVYFQGSGRAGQVGLVHEIAVRESSLARLTFWGNGSDDFGWLTKPERPGFFICVYVCECTYIY